MILETVTSKSQSSWTALTKHLHLSSTGAHLGGWVWWKELAHGAAQPPSAFPAAHESLGVLSEQTLTQQSWGGAWAYIS